jgi:hypothetical protein
MGPFLSFRPLQSTLCPVSSAAQTHDLWPVYQNLQVRAGLIKSDQDNLWDHGGNIRRPSLLPSLVGRCTVVGRS